MSKKFATPEWDINKASENIAKAMENVKSLGKVKSTKRKKTKSIAKTSLSIKKSKNESKTKITKEKLKLSKDEFKGAKKITEKIIKAKKEIKKSTPLKLHNNENTLKTSSKKKKKNKFKQIKEMVTPKGLKDKFKSHNPTPNSSKKLPKNKIKNSTSPKEKNPIEKLSKNNDQVDHKKHKITNKEHEKLVNKLKQVIQSKPTPKTQRTRMLEQLKAARFRYINEQLYTNESMNAVRLFQEEPEAFKAYHQGYRQQVNKWPLNPLDRIISSIMKMPKTLIVGDFGCGEGKLADAVEQKVHSFDLVACNNDIVECDIAKTPLDSESLDVAVYCLSLMGTNLSEIILEGNRVLKTGGILKVAEVESRFETVDTFIAGMERFGFKITHKDFSHNLFYFLDFRKERNIKHKSKLPTISLHPCLYKKR